MNEEGNRMFPRGMVLGLTMAETVLLVVFGILLLFAALFAWERDASRQQRESLEDQLAEYGVEPDLPGPEDPPTDGERWREIVAVVEEDLREERPDAILVILKLAEQWRDEESPARRLAEALHETGSDSASDALRELLAIERVVRESGKSAAELRDAMERTSTAATSEELSSALQDAGIEFSAGNLRDLAAAAASAGSAGLSPGEMHEAIEAAATNRASADLEAAMESAEIPLTPEALRELAALAEASARTGLTPREIQARMGRGRGDRDLRELRRDLEQSGIDTAPRGLRELAEVVRGLKAAGLTPGRIAPSARWL